MKLPILTFLLTLLACSFVGLHSLWRFVVREQLPSLVHAGNAAAMTYAAWLVFLGEIALDPLLPFPTTSALGLLAWGWTSAVAIHLYEIKQRVPYDGLFGGKRK